MWHDLVVQARRLLVVGPFGYINLINLAQSACICKTTVKGQPYPASNQLDCKAVISRLRSWAFCLDVNAGPLATPLVSEMNSSLSQAHLQELGTDE